MMKLISIHAPVKSATRFIDSLGINKANFNPRARKERDLF